MEPLAGRVVSLKKPIQIEKGMSKRQIVDQLGAPSAIEEVQHDGVTAQVWTYKIEQTVSSTIESDGEQERVYIEHATGKMVTVRDPIYRNERVKSLITAKLLFVGDELVAFKEEVAEGGYDVGH